MALLIDLCRNARFGNLNRERHGEKKKKKKQEHKEYGVSGKQQLSNNNIIILVLKLIVSLTPTPYSQYYSITRCPT